MYCLPQWAKRVGTALVLLLLAGDALACSKQRAAVKQLKDAAAKTLNRTPKEVTVKWLTEQKRPPRETLAAAPDQRFAPLETQTYRVRALLVSTDLASDGGVTVTLADPSQPNVRIIAEAPKPECVSKAFAPVARAVWLRLLRQADEGDVLLGPNRGLLKVEVEGVGFFGSVRAGQTAPNGAQLYPLLKFHLLQPAPRTRTR